MDFVYAYELILIYSLKCPLLLGQEHVKREKRILAECDCPFIVNLVASFQDSTSLYMLQEAVMGGELFTYLQVSQTARHCASYSLP